ncbi:2-C-methyl-D-erythritol 4-phosphate cytidylyltransferase [Chryseoglobus sp. 28M-23]|uniref:2-C-methyl-D-erythritol 4-phosphate cytidylyltransferase n=1 Tax=Chryseoglobus sp. 28M-23 TaxID=2772253 RepID=UPI0017476BE8|nr:2-C-methyl-D-erythritol 4-phosphate cytidylyltransferase [Chryseoglobus sp. 28M-23]QOD93333.1 2-C-methyl-D-erythritol 2,4-cyclodiphosphate synthase [Chryseoglobus sp. 28M-23]
MSAPTLAIVVVAAGSGTRLGHAEPKAFVPLAGRNLLEHALERIFTLAEPAHVVVVVPRSHRDEADRIARRVAGHASEHVTIVVGGATRQESVAAGVAAVPDGVDVVLIHDAARALTPTDVFERVVDRVRADGVGVIPALPVIDTIARTTPDGRVRDQVDRSELATIQTPQGFPLEAYRAAAAVASPGHTDDASVFAAAGHPVVTVAGDDAAFKVTTPWDLRRAELLLARARPAIRTGIGIDVHAYDDAQPLWLGGLYWPDEAGLAGHSDGDAIAHAVCDALLSAAGLGDIGSRFGVDDPRFADARGEVFLTATLDLVRDAGFDIVNVAVQVIAARPRFAARRHEVEALLSRLLGAPVSVAATTSDGLGFTGRREGLTAVATALLHS